MMSTRPVTKATGSSSIPQLIFGDLWEYDPAPETADPKLKAKYDPAGAFPKLYEKCVLRG